MSDVDFIKTAKAPLEAKFLDQPDRASMSEYLRVLERMNREFCGIVDFRWPGVPYPLYMRCGSSDLNNFVQIFIHKEYDFPIDFSPSRILDLGGYVGYAAAFLARRFPTAEVVSVEPSPANFQIHTLNTAAYGRIRRLNVAAWGHSTVLDIASTLGGDWANRLEEAGARLTGTPALSIPDILASVGWKDFDFLKCDIEGAERSVFDEAGEFIGNVVQCCAIELHDRVSPGSSEAVKKAFEQGGFRIERSGEFFVFKRDQATASNSPGLSRISLLRPAFGPREITLSNVPKESWAYYTFDFDSCQLHPNDRRGPAAVLSTAVQLLGHTLFECGVSVENPLGHSVDFIVEIAQSSNEMPIAEHKVTVAAGETIRFAVPIDGAAHGLHTVSLKTIMSDTSPTSHKAVANWIAPCFVP